MNARETLTAMVCTDQGDMTVWSPSEVRNALDAYRAEVLREAAAMVCDNPHPGDDPAGFYAELLTDHADDAAGR